MNRITISPDDVCNLKIWNLATGDSPPTAPTSQLRFEKLANKPGAAALQFKRLVDVVYKYILGWDPAARRPLRKTFENQTWDGGLLGITEAFEFAVEEQGRLSLHLHMLVWTAGHSDFIDRLERQNISVNNPAAIRTLATDQKSATSENMVADNGGNAQRVRPHGCTTSTTGSKASYEVLGIEDYRVRDGVEQFLIKWRGDVKRTWQPRSDLDGCNELLSEFEGKRNQVIHLLCVFV